MKRLILGLFLVLISSPLWAGEQILYPNANGTYQQWTAIGGGNHYTEVDDPDGSADTGTYVYINNKTAYQETEALSDFSYPDSTIDSVKIHLQVKKTGTGTITALFLWYDGVELSLGSAVTLTTSYADQYSNLATSPWTAGAWTASEVNALQVGIQGTCAASGRYIYDTQIHAHVYFHAVSTADRWHSITKGFIHGGITK